MSELERRFLADPVKARAAATIGGYAAVFNRHSKNLGGFVEVVGRSFFAKSQGDGWPDVIARYNHDDNMLLGTIAGGTLRLAVDRTGLDYQVELPATRADIYELVERGDIRSSSFAFQVREDDWGTTENGYPLRTLLSGQLIDVAPVITAAYPDATAGLRSLATHVGVGFDEVRSLADKGELIRLLKRSDRPSTTQSTTPSTTSGAQAVASLLGRR